MACVRLLPLIVFLVALPLRAEVKLPAIFSDHMVLQRDASVPIRGTASPGEKITVALPGQSHSTTADATGHWRVRLDPLTTPGPFDLTVNALTFHDVVVGQVWLCSGQSNMSFTLKGAANGPAAVRSANRPTLRLFMVGRTTPDQPRSDLTGHWELCTPDSAAGFSAVAYFFGAELLDALHQPVGLIQSAWGGTRAEAWLPRPTFDALHLPYEPAWTEQWLNPKPASPNRPVVKRPQEAPATLYNGMIAPLAGYAIRGVVWYQGETNTAYPDQYHDVLTALITSWRHAWDEGEFPFLIVQLANFRNTRFWPTLRAAQARVASELPNTGLAVTIDVGDPATIHPRDKQTVGHRLALAARRIAYHQDVPASGPTFKSLAVTGDAAVVSFDHADGGLVAKGDRLLGFELAGGDGHFVPADAAIEGDAVRLTAPGATAPKAVRYGWANDPRCTLYNAAGLPAVPFKSPATAAPHR